MEDLKFIIAKNITDLRKKQKITQAELAERLNYSDKAVSKWERGESIPDVAVLKSIADLFGVTVDYLLYEDHSDYTVEVKKKSSVSRRNRNIITLLSASLVLLIATVAFAFIYQVSPEASSSWMTYVYAVPCTFIVLLVFQAIWGKRKGLIFVYISVIIWSVLLALYLSLLIFAGINFWSLFIIGVPGELIVILWSGLRIHKRGEKDAK